MFFLGFLRKETYFVLKFFWPRRTDPKGFSIENLARKYQKKLSKLSSGEISNQIFNDANSKPLMEDRENEVLAHLSIKKGHWANRDFSEYKQAA